MYAVLTFVLRAGAQLSGLPRPDALDGYAAAVSALVAGVAVFLVPVLVGPGGSIGQRLVWLEPAWPDGPTPVRRLLAGSVGLAWAASFVLGALVDPEGPGQLVALALSVPGLLAPVSVLLTRRRRGLSMVLAGAEVVDSRARRTGPSPVSASSLAG